MRVAKVMISPFRRLKVRQLLHIAPSPQGWSHGLQRLHIAPSLDIHNFVCGSNRQRTFVLRAAGFAQPDLAMAMALAR